MNARGLGGLVAVGILAGTCAVQEGGMRRSGAQEEAGGALPAPRLAGEVSLEAALARRRSRRELRPEALDRTTLGQLLWAAQGITDPAEGKRAAPSAGALYPLELYALTAEGCWRYVPAGHRLEPRGGEDLRPALARAALGQEVVGAAPLVLVLTGVAARTAEKYGPRAGRYVLLEAGHAAQNVLLQAAALGLGAVPVGAFGDQELARVLRLPAGEEPLYVIPVGRPRE